MSRGPCTPWCVFNAARRFCDAYDKWQRLFAAARLTGWDGQHTTQPPDVEYAFDEYVEALDNLRLETTGAPRPNYVELARHDLAARQSP